MLRHRGYYQPGVQSPGSQPVMSPTWDEMWSVITSANMFADYKFIWNYVNIEQYKFRLLPYPDIHIQHNR